MKRFLLLLCAVLLLAAPLHAAAPVTPRPASWAQPVAVTNLKNFYQLDAHVFRAAQPDEQGFAELKQRGIVTILNLRDYHSDDDEAEGLGLSLNRIEMDAGKITVDQLVAALRVIHQSQTPVLIHCWHGSDRTGTVSAAYRVVFQGWSREAAVDELINGGFGYHSIYSNIPELIRTADFDAIKRRVLAP